MRYSSTLKALELKISESVLWPAQALCSKSEDSWSVSALSIAATLRLREKLLSGRCASALFIARQIFEEIQQLQFY